MKYTESSLEKATLGWLEELGYELKFGPEISPEGERPERDSYDEVVLKERLKKAINRLNPGVKSEAREEAFRKVINLPNLSPNLVTNNQTFHDLLTNGVDVEFKTKSGEVRGDKVWLVDRVNLKNNDWLAVNQFRIIENKHNRVPDIVIFVNGLPLVLMELKNPADEKATIQKAYKQIQTYQKEIPTIFVFNEINIISDGHLAKMGTLTSPIEWFMNWRSVSGKVVASRSQNQMKVLIKGIFEKERLLDLLTNFIFFAEKEVKNKKIIGAYHQYFATNKALKETLRAAQIKGNKKIGVVWHTQGSGKSYTMAFYAGKVIKELNNPTVVILTDRNDLDGQLFDTFIQAKELLRQNPEQAEDREDLKRRLKRASGGVIFTTIQKFLPEDRTQFPLLSERDNLVVIADEAHRSQYGFRGKIRKNVLAYGFAKYVRDALPKASFIGFTGTPIALKDRNTAAVFGGVIDTYDVTRAVEDQATVPIYYEARLAKVALDEVVKDSIDPEFEDITEGESEAKKGKLKSKWARLEAMVGAPKRVELIAQDIVDHFAKRLAVINGKGMVVTMSRRIAVDLYREIVKLRPDWHSDNDLKGKVKVVITGSASDKDELQPHIRNKEAREKIGNRMKDPEDELQLVIVCSMWLTGFDAPSVHTMYLDKPLYGHTLMQAIARVNRIFRDKQAGLIVDYIGIAYELQVALDYYTKSDRQLTAIPQEKAVKVMLEKYEVVKQMFDKFKYQDYFAADEKERTEIQTAAIDYILQLKDGAERYKAAVTALSYAYSIAIPHDEAIKIRDVIAFFQAIKAGIVKLEPEIKGGPTEEDYDLAIKQIIAGAVVSDEVIDIFKVSGLKSPNLSILSEEFLAQVQDMEHKNVALEILNKLLNEEIQSLSEKNLVASRSFLQMLEETIRKYQNRTITSAQVIIELVKLAKDLKKEYDKGKELGLSDEEIAFYDALAENESAVIELGDKVLRQMAQELLMIIRKNASIDWTRREAVQAKLRIYIKRLLKRYNYPPDKQEKATKTVLEQAELLAKVWTN